MFLKKKLPGKSNVVIITEIQSFSTQSQDLIVISFRSAAKSFNFQMIARQFQITIQRVGGEIAKIPNPG